MRMIVSVGYMKMLLGGSATMDLVNALKDAKVVSSQGYGEDRIFEVQKNQDISISFIEDNDVRLPEVKKDEYLETILKLNKEKEALSSQMYDYKWKSEILEEELKKLKDEKVKSSQVKGGEDSGSVCFENL